jgi:hypothetical protein
MSNDKALTVQNQAIAHGEMTVEAVIERKRRIGAVMSAVMKEGEHYGRIPGCGPKPTLFKAGAEILAMTFGFAPTFRIERADLAGGHREYQVICTLTHIASGAVVSEGVGCSSSMESKHRWRHKGRDRVENSDPSDVFNTILKMAKKRAQVDATLTACGASDMLAQDLEDLSGGDGDDQPGLVERFAACETPAEFAAIDADMRSGWGRLTKVERERATEAFHRAKARIKSNQPKEPHETTQADPESQHRPPS